MSVSSCICNSYTMGCPPVCGDNPRALESGLSYVQVNKHCIKIYIAYISVDLAHDEIFRAKVGKGGIIGLTSYVIIKDSGKPVQLHSLTMAFIVCSRVLTHLS